MLFMKDTGESRLNDSSLPYSGSTVSFLSSDYHSTSLLDAACRLARRTDNAYDLPCSIASFGVNPALRAGLRDRGSIAPDKRADLLRVKERECQLLIQSVWRGEGGYSEMSGRLFYLMGPSGSGKDSLLRRCRERLVERRCLIAPRYITREPELSGENHLWLSEAEFQQRVSLGTFALHWSANGHRYGIGIEIDQWLALGLSVLVNGSRGHLGQARARYGEDLVPLLLQVEPHLLQQRLIARGRETPQQIAARIERSQRLAENAPEDVLVIDNSRELDHALGQLLGAILGSPEEMVL